MKRYDIGPLEANQRLDKFVAKVAPRLPKSLLYKSIRTKRIKCNRGRCTANYILQPGDVLELYLEDDFFLSNQADLPMSSGMLDIIYEDESILLANKPAGISVHGDRKDDSLQSRLNGYFFGGNHSKTCEAIPFTPSFVHRLDRNTSGIVIAAKTFPAAQVLSEKIKANEVEKTYLCLVQGVPNPPVGRLEGYHSKDSTTNQVSITSLPRPGAKEVITEYRVLEENGDESLVEVQLHTGRSHQIRAHMASIGHPVVGDVKYGYSGGRKLPPFFLALCAYRVKFVFKSNARILNYLSGKRFQLEAIPFSLCHNRE